MFGAYTGPVIVNIECETEFVACEEVRLAGLLLSTVAGASNTIGKFEGRFLLISDIPTAAILALGLSGMQQISAFNTPYCKWLL